MGWLVVPLVVLVAIAFLLLEVRVRRPDEIVLRQAKGGVRPRTGRFYLRHLSLSVPATVHTLSVQINAESAGHLGVQVGLSLTVAAHPQQLDALIRAGGWSAKAVERAAEELRNVLPPVVGGLVEQRNIEALSSEVLTRGVHSGLVRSATALGLDVLAVSVKSLGAVDPKIAEGIRERETARVHEQSETAAYESRVAVARARAAADEQLAEVEHALEMKRLALRKEEERQKATIERQRVEDENARRLLRLEVDRQEIELLRESPELLVLTPQVARLAEASQSLRNARTVVSLSGGEGGEPSPVLKTLLSLVEQAAGATAQKRSAAARGSQGSVASS